MRQESGNRRASAALESRQGKGTVDACVCEERDSPVPYTP